MSRPALLFPLFTPASALKGVGTRLAQLLGKIGVQTVRDLVWLPPFSIIDRRSGWLEAGQIATLEGTIGQIKPAQRRGQPTRVVLQVEGGKRQLDIVLFNMREDYIERMFPQNGQVVVSGRVESYQGRMQMSNPDYVCAPSEREATIPAIETVYPPHRWPDE
jgi:ATP-dependent DNA helicase RecG